jgi:hypothetical protein
LASSRTVDRAWIFGWKITLFDTLDSFVKAAFRDDGASVKPVLSCKLKGAYLGMIR